MNVLEDTAGLAELQKLGARSGPVLSRGDNFTFGQAVYLSRVISAAQAVDGVESVRADSFRRHSEHVGAVLHQRFIGRLVPVTRKCGA